MAPVLPWVFVIGVAIGAIAAQSKWQIWHPAGRSWHTQDRGRELPIPGLQSGPNARYAVTVLRTIDGDTFAARVALAPGRDFVTHVRLRGIDAPELKAMCADELRRAEAAADALDRLLREGGVMIFNIGPDKYEGRIVADIATRQTPNVSAALLAGGYARAYDGGHREGWCG